jgi:SAM-dependent methyltransferase
LLDPRVHESIARFRRILEANGYLEKAQEMLGTSLGPTHLRADLPLYLRRLAAPEPLNILMRLFAFYVPVSDEDARIAFAPMTLDEVAALGLVEREPGGVRGSVGLMILGSTVIACDRLAEPKAEPRPDYVLGLNPPAVTLANLTVRRPVRKALDLACGGGIQGLLAAAHTDQVVAVDLNPRALVFTRFNSRLNGLAEPDCREGSFFAPVAGERFDLIACNPPYAISPDSRFLFRDGGGDGDAVCEEVVRGAAAHLEEDGYATVICNWALREGEDPSAPPRRWVEGSGCDAWILMSEVKDPLTYAAGWSRIGRDYESALDRWVAYDRERGIAQIGLGAVILRRRARGPNWIRADVMPNPPPGPCGEQIQAVFAAQDRLRDLATDGALGAEVFRVADDLEVLQILERRDGGYAMTRAEVRLTGGFGFRGAVDAHTLELLRKCDGRTRLGRIVEEMTAGSDVAPDVLEVGVTAAVRRLVALGFMVPVADREEGRKHDAGSLEVA